MYCEEPIINVWYLEGKEGWENDGKGDWDFPDYHFGMVYYFAGKNGLVLQTEHYYITVSGGGVKTYRSRDEFVTPDVYMYNYDDWYDDDDDKDSDGDEESEKESRVLTEEGFYLIGERIRNVTKTENGWVIEFDHLSLTVLPAKEEEQPWSSYYNYLPYLSTGHKLKRCECGGKAQLLYDHVDEYYIRCASCRRYTYPDYRLSIAVKHWNAGDCPVKGDMTPMECFLARKGKTIRNIFFRLGSQFLEPNHIVCDEPILQFDDTSFELTFLYVPVNRSMFNIVYQVSSFNPEYWPDRIELEEGEDGFRFVSFMKDSRNEIIVLTTGKRKVIITAMLSYLDIRIEQER